MVPPKHTQTQFFLSPSSYGFTLSSFFSTLITICDNLVQLVIVCSPHINSVRVGIYHSYLLLYPQCWTELNEQMNEEKFELSYEEYVSIFQGNKYCVCGRGQGGQQNVQKNKDNAKEPKHLGRNLEGNKMIGGFSFTVKQVTE